MKAKNLLLSLALLFVAGFMNAQINESLITSSNKYQRPNILIIMTDQQSATMLSCAGNKWLHTPAIDGLASAGIRFEKAYVTNPVCMPSRFSIQTGMFSSVAGIRENDYPINKENQPIIESLYPRSLGNIFRKAGYDTYYGGKFHVPLQNRNATPWGYNVITNEDREGLASDASNFLLNRKPGDKPFLLFVSFINPHDICFNAIRFGWPESQAAKQTPTDLFNALKMPAGVGKKEFFDKYCPPLPPNHQPMVGEPYSVDSLISLRDFRKAVREKWTDEDWRLHRWAYARLTERVDSLIGVVIKALDKSGFRDNTIVIFTSDHGENDASHKLEHKTVFYEESARVPFIISYPWLKEKGRVDSLHIMSNGLDLLPTICDLSGIQPPRSLNGKSLVPILDKVQVKDWRKHIFIENELGYLVHTGRYKYQLDDKNGDKPREVFSDLKVDPGETFNMINDTKYAKIIDELRMELQSHIGKAQAQLIPPGKETGDKKL